MIKLNYTLMMSFSEREEKFATIVIGFKVSRSFLFRPSFLGIFGHKLIIILLMSLSPR